jgi:hypothetical protein
VSGGDVATLDASRRDFARATVSHPVLWDRGNANHKNFGVTRWPAAFLVGADGRVFWQGDPHALRHRPEERADFRRRLEEQLGQARAPDDRR